MHIKGDLHVVIWLVPLQVPELGIIDMGVLVHVHACTCAVEWA